MKKLISASAALGLVVALGFAAPTFAATKNHGSSTTPCTDDGKITTSPTVLWPPNHKDNTITFAYTDPDGAASLNIISNLHNEIADDGTEINGTGNTPLATDSTSGMAVDGGPTDADPDDGEVTVQVTARAERSGHKNADGGRIYRWDWSCRDDSGAMQMSDPDDPDDDIQVFVPHDCRGGAASYCKG
jgi:hypothetical protein